LLREKIVKDHRHAVEFIMQHTPYRMEDLSRVDVFTFLDILEETERRVMEQIERMKADQK
jgi:hypothetical protein